MNKFIHSVENFFMKSWNGLYKMLCKIWDQDEGVGAVFGSAAKE